MDFKQFEEALPILNTLINKGYNAYFVGGGVRDYLLKRKINDIDIVTSAKLDEIEHLFTQVIPLGAEHGTVIVRYQGKSYEISSYRADQYTGNKKLENIPYRLLADLAHRDFTINAMALDRAGTIIDPFHGQKDLINKKIRAVENASDRFKEDPLRMLRALRFASEIGFNIEISTLQAIKNLRSLIEDISIERITKEMILLLKGNDISNAFYYLRESKLIEHLPIFKSRQKLILNIPEKMFPFLSFAEAIVYFHFVDETISITKWIKAWKGSNKQKSEAKHLKEAIDHYSHYGLTNWLLYCLPNSLDFSFIQLIDRLGFGSISFEQLTNQRRELPISSRKEVEINGSNLIRMFNNRQPGPWIEKKLTSIEYAIVMNKLSNDKQNIKDWIKCHPLEKN